MENFFLSSDIEQLLRVKTEGKNLDYKQGLNWERCSNDEKAELVKDILAMSNTKDGGSIIFGVRDEDFALIGLSGEEFASFDQTKLNDFLHRYTDPKFSCFVHKHVVDEKNVVSINVPEFPEIPIICKKDANASNGKSILKNGALYTRTDKATSEQVPSAQEMRELLGRAIAKRGDELLGNIERLIKGRPPRAADDAAERYKEELREADGFLEASLGKDLTHLGSWAVNVYPTQYSPKRIPDHQTIKKFIEKSEVQLRGWTFPHTSLENSSNFTMGTQSYRTGNLHSEGYRAYLSGLFAWKGAFWEDKRGLKDEGKLVLSFTDTIYFMTEVLLFCKRYYELIAPEDSIHLDVLLNGTRDRRLAPVKHPALALSDWYVAKENPIRIQEDIRVVELKASYKEIANKIIRQIFTIFNWNDAKESTIDGWQTQLLERRF